MSRFTQVMDKFSDKMQIVLDPVARFLSNNKYFQTVISGMVTVMPLTMIASLFTMVEAIPKMFPFLPSWSPEVSAAILVPYNTIFGLMALVISFSIAYNHGKHYKMNQLYCGIISLIAFVITVSTLEGGNFSARYFGYAGILTAVLVGILSIELYRLLTMGPLALKLPPTIPPHVNNAFMAMIPWFGIVTVFYLFRLGFVRVSGMMLPDLIQKIFTPMLTFSGNSLGYSMLVNFLDQFFFTLGLHGWLIVQAPMMAFSTAVLAEQASAYMAGLPLPYITTGSWSAGGFYRFPLYLLILSKSKRNKTTAKVTLGPALFGITEPFLFGTPIVLNPMLMIAYSLATPLTVTPVFFFAIKNGLLNHAYMSANAAIPAPIGTFMSNGGDPRTFLWFAVSFFLGLIWYYPFIKAWDKQCLKEEKEIAEQMAQEEALAEEEANQTTI